MAAAAPAVPPFALAPALTNNAVIDYTTSEGVKIYKAATVSLYSKDEEAFDCLPAGLHDFLNLLKVRAELNGWDNSILAIPDDIANPLGDTKNLLTSYGDISIEHLREHAQTYIDQQTRAAQDSAQLFQAIYNSLSKEGRSKVTIWEKDYRTNELNSGVLFLKVVIRESHIDTNATTSWIRQQLSSLDVLMVTAGYDIEKLNSHVMDLVQGLQARGQVTNDLLANLFKGYKAAQDKEFVAYIKKKEEDYEEGIDIEPDHLMNLAKNKYQILKQNEKWNAPSVEEEKIMALEAQIKKLQKGRNKSKDTNKNGKNFNNKGDKKARDEWITKPPTSAEKGKPKQASGKTWWWCPTHKKWTLHKPEECKKKIAQDKASKEKKGDQNRINQNLFEKHRLVIMGW